jgi:hypothetical protein
MEGLSKKLKRSYNLPENIIMLGILEDNPLMKISHYYANVPKGNSVLSKNENDHSIRAVLQTRRTFFFYITNLLVDSL